MFAAATGRATGHTGRVLREDGETLEIRAASPARFAGRVFVVSRAEVRSLPESSPRTDMRGEKVAGFFG